MAGILLPVETHRFRVIHPASWEHFTAQIASVNLDLKERKLTILVRQTVLAETFNRISAVVRSFVAPAVDVMGRDGDILFRLTFQDAVVEKHELVFDYAVGSVAHHKIVWSFKSSEAIEVLPVEPSGDSDGKFPTPEEAVRQYLAERKTE